MRHEVPSRRGATPRTKIVRGALAATAVAAVAALPAAAQADVVTPHTVKPTVVTPQVSNAPAPAPSGGPIAPPTVNSTAAAGAAFNDNYVGGEPRQPATKSNWDHSDASLTPQQVSDRIAHVQQVEHEGQMAIDARANAAAAAAALEIQKMAQVEAEITMAGFLNSIGWGASVPHPQAPIPNATPSDPGGVAAIIDDVFGTGASKKRDGSEQQQQ